MLSQAAGRIPTDGWEAAETGLSALAGLKLLGYVRKGKVVASRASIVSRITPGSLPGAEEASLLRTLGHIDAGTMPTGPLSKKWGHSFKNWNEDLPGGRGAASPYKEYRVAPSPGTSGAGTNRIVVNTHTGEVYYTWTHYGDAAQPAFVQIR